MTPKKKAMSTHEPIDESDDYVTCSCDGLRRTRADYEAHQGGH